MKDTLVVTPTLGVRETLARTVSSVQRNGCGRVFHVIVAPEKCVDKLQADFPDVTVISEGSSRSLYEAINVAIVRFSGQYKYFSYINDDDYWCGGYVSLFHILDCSRSVQLAYGKIALVDLAGNELRKVPVAPRGLGFVRLQHLGVDGFTQQAVLMRSEVFRLLGVFDVRYRLLADCDMWARAATAKLVMRHTTKLCACYAVHAGQLMTQINAANDERSKILQKLPRPTGIEIVFESLLFYVYNIRSYISFKVFGGIVRKIKYK